jgi:hypothetical protein
VQGSGGAAEGHVTDYLALSKGTHVAVWVLLVCPSNLPNHFVIRGVCHVGEGVCESEWQVLVPQSLSFGLWVPHKAAALFYLPGGDLFLSVLQLSTGFHCVGIHYLSTLPQSVGP